MGVVEEHRYIAICDRCGKRVPFTTHGRLLHMWVPQDKMPSGWKYIDIPDMGFDPYLKQDFETKRTILVCDQCK